MNRLFFGILSCGVFVLFLSGCLPTNTPAPENPSPSPTPLEEEVQRMEPQNPVIPEEADIQITMQGVSFTPHEITAQAGQTLVIELISEEGIHNFYIDELQVMSETLTTGTSTFVTLSIPEDASGQTYTFYCDVGDHRARGMEGTLTIE